MNLYLYTRKYTRRSSDGQLSSFFKAHTKYRLFVTQIAHIPLNRGRIEEVSEIYGIQAFTIYISFTFFVSQILHKIKRQGLNVPSYFISKYSFRRNSERERYFMISCALLVRSFVEGEQSIVCEMIQTFKIILLWSWNTSKLYFYL